MIGDLLSPGAPGPVEKNGVTFGALGDSWVHLCIDMQRMFSEATDWQTPWLPIVLPKVAALVEIAPERTVFTRFITAKTPRHAPGAWQRYYERWPNMTLERLAPELLDIVPELQGFAPPARLIDKHVYSPWADGQLHAMLSALGVDTLIVSGAETEVCVLAAVIGGMDLGYRMIIATDAICSSADETHEAAIEVYRNRFGMQIEVAEVHEIVAEVAAARRGG